MSDFVNLDVGSYDLIVTMLYNALFDKDLDLGEGDKIQISKVLYQLNQLGLQKHLSKSQLLLSMLQPFLGRTEAFKKHVQISVEQIKQPGFNVENILTIFANKFIGSPVLV